MDILCLHTKVNARYLFSVESLEHFHICYFICQSAYQIRTFPRKVSEVPVVYPCSMVSTGFVEVLQATHGHSFNPGIVLPGSLYIH